MCIDYHKYAYRQDASEYRFPTTHVSGKISVRSPLRGTVKYTIKSWAPTLTIPLQPPATDQPMDNYGRPNFPAVPWVRRHDPHMEAHRVYNARVEANNAHPQAHPHAPPSENDDLEGFMVGLGDMDLPVRTTNHAIGYIQRTYHISSQNRCFRKALMRTMGPLSRGFLLPIRICPVVRLPPRYLRSNPRRRVKATSSFTTSPPCQRQASTCRRLTDPSLKLRQIASRTHPTSLSFCIALHMLRLSPRASLNEG